ncbi:MAG: hypothetical protein JW820_10520 [Spirochaetales bacterium]|nr:hypothetical protein [Spirochaetales bacterium]
MERFEVVFDWFRDNWKDLVPISISVGAAILAGFALAQRVKATRYELYWEMLKSYSSPEMLRALQRIWTLVEKEAKWDKDALRKKYCGHFDQGDDVHGERRVVSTLFQQLAFLRDNNLVPRKFRTTFPDLDLRIIEFLYTIEEEAIGTSARKPKSIAQENARKKPMYRMYNDWLAAHQKRKQEK